MNLTGKLIKFSIIPFLVLALNSKDAEAQTQHNVESLGQMAQEHDLRDTYREEIVLKNLKRNLSLETGISISTPQNSYLRSHFPIQYGGEISGNVKINEKFKATAFANFSKGNSPQEQEREINNSSIGAGIEYSCRNVVDLGVGLVNKNQNISGPKNGFPGHLNKTGIYVQVKKEIPIIPEELSLYFKARLNKISNELSVGLIFKP